MQHKSIAVIRKHWDKILLSIFILIYIGVMGTLSILRHNAFASGFDLSNMDHTIWNTLHGHFFSLRFEEEYVSRLAVHADFILIILSPLYLIWDNVRALIVAETVFLAIGAVPTYLLSLKILKDKFISLAIVLAYLLNPGMQWTDLYDFHGVSLAISFFLFAFYFAYSKKWHWYSLFIFLAILTKENISLNIAMLGLAILFVMKNRVVGAATFIVAILWFFVMVYGVMPHFSEAGKHWALEGIGNNSTNPVPGLIKDNLQLSNFTRTFFSEGTINYYILLLKPYAFIPLVGFPWLLLTAPEFAINILRGTTTIHFHYDSGITPALVIATIFGLSYISIILNKLRITKLYTKKILYVFALFLVSFALRYNYHYSPLPTTPSCWCFIYNVTEEDKAFEKELQRIPKDASITASIEVRPHVNHREDVWFVPSATSSAQFIALIRQNRLIGNYEPKEYENKLIPALLSSQSHKVIFKSENFYLFERISRE